MSQRDYHQNCALARAADLLGERWTLLIVRDLLVAPRRFSELEQRLKGMGTNLLSRRLKDMQTTGLISGGEARTPYALTDMGRSLEPMVLQMVRWSLNWVRPAERPGGLHFPDWDLLALKSIFTADPRMKRWLVARFSQDSWEAWVRIDRTGFQCGLGPPPNKLDVDFPCSVAALRAPAPVIAELPAPMRDKARRFIACFLLA